MAAFDGTQSLPSLLIVDDEVMIRDLCAQALSGYRVAQAGNGQEAVDILAREDIDIVLTDIMMPVMNGLDLLAGIKESSPNQPVIVMTGFGDKEVILKALKAGADDFIHKPINLLQLKTAIAKTLEKRALREELVQLKQVDRLKSEFLGLISHKLKTPMTVISLFLQNLERDVELVHAPGFRDNLKLILEESGHLSSLIHDLLNFSSIILRDSRGERELTSPATLIQECLLETRDLAARREIHVDSYVEGQIPNLLIDRQKVFFSLRTILENALKFSPGGTLVCLEAERGQHDLCIRVADQGPGIPVEEQQKIFERFYQIDPDRTGQVRGFGLGLFYARQFIKEQGGAIDLQSKPGQGTVVTLRLPIPEQAAGSGPQVSS
ncbi:MAG TPA: response regulator [Geothermobacteraceae bacterium]|nr:response regulator [Geothermobacteraceae bacterium]